MKKEVEQLIAATAKKAAEEVVRQQGSATRPNHYKDTERLLRNYKAMKRLYDHPEEYPLTPPARSKSVTVAPPSGAGFRSHEDIMDEVIEARLRSYGVSCAQFRWIDDVIKQFENKPEFIVIRMYYFGEDAYGNDRPEGSKNYTFEEISEALAEAGLSRSEKTLRTWRSQLVQDMTVCLFVMDGTLSLGNRETRKAGSREESEKVESGEEAGKAESHE